MLQAERQVDNTASNLANVNTTGFKKDFLAAMAAPEMLTSREPSHPRVPSAPLGTAVPIGIQSTGVMGAETYTDFSPGPITNTERNLDVAILNDGFFTVADNQGNTYYTRNGAFVIAPDGSLTTIEGLTVLGEGGVIQTPGAGSIEISANGSVFADGEMVDMLQIAFFSNPQALTKIGHNRFRGPAPDGIGTANLQSGALEQSNANVIDSMINLIENHRIYEADSRVLQTLDSTLERTVNDVGSLM